MSEHAAAGLVQHEAAERLVAGDEAGLLPERVAGRRGDAADIAHLADDDQASPTSPSAPEWQPTRAIMHKAKERRRLPMTIALFTPR